MLYLLITVYTSLVHVPIELGSIEHFLRHSEVIFLLIEK